MLAICYCNVPLELVRLLWKYHDGSPSDWEILHATHCCYGSLGLARLLAEVYCMHCVDWEKEQQISRGFLAFAALHALVPQYRAVSMPEKASLLAWSLVVQL